ncbi:MAG TPA: hypothetical protein VJ756_22845 [Terriglobales bacterium]|nr:hypothetical protein [Terriglobales bacterium]
MAVVFGTLGYTGAAHGWLLLAKALFSVAVLGFAMALLAGQLVVKKIS